MKYQSFVINIINLLGVLFLISITLFLTLISKLVPLTPKTARFFKYFYPAAGSLKIISDSRIRLIIAKGPKYRFPVKIDFQKCRKILQHLLMNFAVVGISESMLSVML